MLPQCLLKPLGVSLFERRDDFGVLFLFHVEAVASVSLDHMNTGDLNIRLQTLMDFLEPPVPRNAHDGRVKLRIQLLMPPQSLFVNSFLSKSTKQLMQMTYVGVGMSS